MMFGMIVVTFFFGCEIVRMGCYKCFLLFGFVFMTVVLLGLVVSMQNGSCTLIDLCLFVFGFGFGFVM